MSRPPITRRSLELILPLLVLAAMPALAGPPPTFESDPDQGPPGTVIQVSGSLCTREVEPVGFGLALGGPPPPGTTVHVELVGPQPGATVVAQVDLTPDPSGNWQGTLTVPAGAAPGTYLVTAVCDPDGLGSEQPFNYAPNQFVVPAPADPAEPVDAEVTFTG